MFGKISKLALGMNLIGGMMSWNCNAAETVQVPGEVTMMIKSFADSLEFKKPTRVFITIIAALDKIIPELDNLSQIPSTNQRFFLALHKIFSNQNLEVNDDSVAAILDSADKGCKGAQEMVIAAFGKGTEDKIGDKRTLLKKQMQDVLSEPSSDSDDSGADFGEICLDKNVAHMDNAGGSITTENLEANFDDTELTSDPLYVAETARQLADNLALSRSGKTENLEVIEYDFKFLVKAKYDSEYLKSLLPVVNQVDMKLYETLSSFLKDN